MCLGWFEAELGRLRHEAGASYESTLDASLAHASGFHPFRLVPKLPLGNPLPRSSASTGSPCGSGGAKQSWGDCVTKLELRTRARWTHPSLTRRVSTFQLVPTLPLGNPLPRSSASTGSPCASGGAKQSWGDCVTKLELRNESKSPKS